MHTAAAMLTTDRSPKGARTSPPAPHGLRLVELDADAEIVVLTFPVGDHAACALTPAERVVVTSILAGRSNAQIAAERGTSVRTIANQVASIFKKLHVGSRAELVATCALFEESA